MSAAEASVDDRQLVALKRKLESLQYRDDFDRRSAPLVQKLLDDLVHTTESYRALKVRRGRMMHSRPCSNLFCLGLCLGLALLLLKNLPQ